MFMFQQHLPQGYNKPKGSLKEEGLDYASEEEAEATLRQMTPTSLKLAADTDPAELLHPLASLRHSSDVRSKKLSDSYSELLLQATVQAKKHQRQIEERQRQVESCQAENLSLKTKVDRLQAVANQNTPPEFPN